MSEPLVLLSGLPGTGKTRLAIELSRRLHLPVLARDRFQSQLRLQGLAGREGTEGYELLFDQADLHLSSGIGVILDAVFPKRRFRQRARKLADRYEARLKPIICICSSEELLRKRIVGREQSVPHWTPVSWEEVKKVRAYYEPWPEGSALHIDAVNEFRINVSDALDWIEVKNGAR